ncbi:MAG: gamma carbonic anhydrase family protein [Alphaproteobacteria bacterium]|nr:gamma carbonic anhydrase family protein [Alphaproteobacteria bacterium]
MKKNEALILPYKNIYPNIGENVFLAPTAQIIGKVTIGDHANIWFNCVLRGDVHEISVGEGTNIQDGTIIHVTTGGLGTHIGQNVTIGHAALLHDCTLEDECFIGMGATLLDKVYVEKGAMIAAGALVTPGKRIPKGELWAGSPAKFMRFLTEAESLHISHSAKHYQNLAQQYLDYFKE